MDPLVTIIIIVVVIGIPAIYVIANYNRMTRVRQHIKESWSDIDVEMKRRYELIPNLVNTVKGYAKHEQETLAMVIEARNKAQASKGSATDQAIDESALMINMKKLFAVVERYPELKADTNFLALQKELANTEDRIAAARRFFNANTREMNQLCEMFPTSIIANMFGFKKGDFFELDSAAERVVPQIEL